jgi:hypothetical protein
MGPEPLPRVQYPVSILFVNIIIIQVDGMRQGTLYIAFCQWRSQKGETIHRSNRECGSTMEAGQSKPQGMRE